MREALGERHLKTNAPPPPSSSSWHWVWNQGDMGRMEPRPWNQTFLTWVRYLHL